MNEAVLDAVYGASYADMPNGRLEKRRSRLGLIPARFAFPKNRQRRRSEN